MPQLRQNVITGDWVVIAPERAKRPDQFVEPKSSAPDAVDGNCVFCLESENYTKYRLKDFESNDIWVVPNKFPAFVEDKSQCSPRTYHLEDGFYHAKPAVGGHDIIVVKPHDLNIYSFSQTVWSELFAMIAARYRYWRRDCNTEYAMAIYNEGHKAAASIVHPHAQLIASDIIPNQIVREQGGAEVYYEKHTRCVFCDLIEHERKQKVRVVYESDMMIAFCFYAARFPFEIWLTPKRHQGHFDQTTSRDYAALADAMAAIAGKLGRVLKNPPLNFYLHDLPNALADSQYYHWHLEITPRVTNYGGYELGSGVVIDVMSPESAAGYLQFTQSIE